MNNAAHQSKNPYPNGKEPYKIGVSAATVLAGSRPRRTRLQGDSDISAELDRIRIVVKLTGPVPTFRVPDLSDPKERAAARRLACRSRNRIKRKKEVMAIAACDAEDDFEREVEDIEAVLDTYHVTMAIDDGGAVTRVMVALGPNWESTDPNAPTPRVVRGVPGFGSGFDKPKPRDSLNWNVKDVCRVAGLACYDDDWLVERVLLDTLGQAVEAAGPELRGRVKQMVEVERRKLRRERPAA